MTNKTNQKHNSITVVFVFISDEWNVPKAINELKKGLSKQFIVLISTELSIHLPPWPFDDQLWSQQLQPPGDQFYFWFGNFKFW